MLQTLTSSPDHASILTMGGVENGLISERQHDIELRLFKHLSDACLNSFTSFKDFADFSKRIFVRTVQSGCFQPSFIPPLIVLFSYTCSKKQLRYQFQVKQETKINPNKTSEMKSVTHIFQRFGYILRAFDVVFLQVIFKNIAYVLRII